MNPNNKYKLTIVMLLILSFCQAQNRIDDIEAFLFSEIFNSNKSIREFIELNDKNDTIRYWTFDENYKLIREVDYRHQIWSSSADGMITYESTTFKIEIIYNYNQDGQIQNYVVIKNVDGNILNTIHEFKYPNSFTNIETYKTDDDNIDLDFEITNIYEKSKLKKSVQVIKRYVGTSRVQTISRIEFSYDEGNRLTSQNQYHTKNSFSENEKPETGNEVLGANTNFMYDKKGRLRNIYEVEYTEEGLPKLIKNVYFEYKGKSKRIKNIKINYGEDYYPNFVEYEIKYKRNGDLSNIKVNDNFFNYLTRR